jgi:hypothetical protein
MSASLNLASLTAQASSKDLPWMMQAAQVTESAAALSSKRSMTAYSQSEMNSD